jgi:hypothetical protein
MAKLKVSGRSDAPAAAMTGLYQSVRMVSSQLSGVGELKVYEDVQKSSGAVTTGFKKP